MGSTGEQLAHWCRKHGVEGFRGVFCSDGMPVVHQPRDSCYVINHSRCGFGSGTHWLACRLRGDTAYWWDSYGVPPTAVVEQRVMTPKMEPPPFMKWLRDCGIKTVHYNPIDVQSVASEVCGGRRTAPWRTPRSTRS